MPRTISLAEPLNSRPAQWQTFDIYYRSPVADEDRRVSEPGRYTLIHDGKLAVNGEPFNTPTFGGRGRSGDPGPITLRDERARVRFRNIRVTPLDKETYPTRQFVAPLDPEWLRRADKLGPRELARFVEDAVQARNPGTEIRLDETLKDGVVWEAALTTNPTHGRDALPFQAFRQLRVLSLGGLHGTVGYDDGFEARMLGNLKHLSNLTFQYCHVDPSGIERYPIKKLIFAPSNNLTGVEPFTHLGRLPLEWVVFETTGPLGNECLTAVKGRPLRAFALIRMKVDDLSAIKGQPIDIVRFTDLPVTDIESVVTPRLAHLMLHDTAVKDLAPLQKATGLRELNLRGNPLTDLAPLANLKLSVVYLEEGKQYVNTEALREMKSLQAINGIRATEFWKEYDSVKDE